MKGRWTTMLNNDKLNWDDIDESRCSRGNDEQKGEWTKCDLWHILEISNESVHQNNQRSRYTMYTTWCRKYVVSNEYTETSALTIERQRLRGVLKLIRLGDLTEWGTCLRRAGGNWWTTIDNEGLSDKANNKVWEQLSRYLVSIYVHEMSINT